MTQEDIKKLEDNCREELEGLKGDKFEFYYDNPAAAVDTIEHLSKKILKLIGHIAKMEELN